MFAHLKLGDEVILVGDRQAVILVKDSASVSRATQGMKVKLADVLLRAGLSTEERTICDASFTCHGYMRMQ